MGWFTKFSLKNGTAIVILCMLVMGYGLFAATQIKQQTFPDLEFPAVFIQAAQPGASTEEIEAAVLAQCESNLDLDSFAADLHLCHDCGAESDGLYTQYYDIGRDCRICRPDCG